MAADRRRRSQRRWWTRSMLLLVMKVDTVLVYKTNSLPNLGGRIGSHVVNFLQMPTKMLDAISHRVGSRIGKQDTFYRNPLEPGLKLAITLRHFASGANYRTCSMQYGCRVRITPDPFSYQR